MSDIAEKLGHLPVYKRAVPGIYLPPDRYLLTRYKGIEFSDPILDAVLGKVTIGRFDFTAIELANLTEQNSPVSERYYVGGILESDWESKTVQKLIVSPTVITTTRFITQERFVLEQDISVLKQNIIKQNILVLNGFELHFKDISCLNSYQPMPLPDKK